MICYYFCCITAENKIAYFTCDWKYIKSTVYGQLAAVSSIIAGVLAMSNWNISVRSDHNRADVLYYQPKYS